MPTRVLIADDHAIVRRGLRAIIDAESSLELIGETTNGKDTIKAVLADQPDVLILDLSMPDMDGIEVAEKLRLTCPDLKMLILTVHKDNELARAALKAGASGYILKHAAESELVAAIRRILRGESYVDPSMVPHLLVDAAPRKGSRTLEEELTPREMEVLELIADGYTNRQIGEMLNISIRTVESHRASISAKLNIRSRVDMVRFVRARSLTD